MPDAARIFAFDACAARDANALAAPGVTIAVQRPTVLLDLRGDPADAALARAMREHFDVALPLAPNTCAGTRGVRALALGPAEWLLVFRDLAPQTPALPGSGTIADVSHGRAALRICGPDVRAALAKGCSLDLDARVLPVDRCAQTAIAKVSVILDHVQPGVFDLYCPRSYAGSFWDWLTEACAEYGCKVESRPG